MNELVEVPVPRPRTEAQFLDPSFMATRKHIDQMMHPPGQEPQETPVMRPVIRDPDVV